MFIFHIDALAQDNDEFLHRLPRRNGIALWRSLYESNLGRLGVVLTKDTPNDQVEVWLRTHDIRAAVYEVLDSATGPFDQQIENIMIQHGMRSGDLYVDVNPSLVAKVLSRGIPTLLLGDPLTVRPEWEQERDPRNWDEVVQELDRQAVLRSKKAWKELE